MYQLRVHFPGEDTHRHLVSLRSGAEVMTRIPELLAQHPGCERIAVYANGAKLFSVDCKGNREP